MCSLESYSSPLRLQSWKILKGSPNRNLHGSEGDISSHDRPLATFICFEILWSEKKAVQITET